MNKITVPTGTPIYRCFWGNARDGLHTHGAWFAQYEDAQRQAQQIRAVHDAQSREKFSYAIESATADGHSVHSWEVR